MTITIPLKLRELVTKDKLCYITITDKKIELRKGEKIEFG
jgi:hypothetical protein